MRSDPRRAGRSGSWRCFRVLMRNGVRTTTRAAPSAPIKALRSRPCRKTAAELARAAWGLVDAPDEAPRRAAAGISVQARSSGARGPRSAARKQRAVFVSTSWKGCRCEQTPNGDDYPLFTLYSRPAQGAHELRQGARSLKALESPRQTAKPSDSAPCWPLGVPIRSAVSNAPPPGGGPLGAAAGPGPYGRPGAPPGRWASRP
jgi:hypothetical protein